MSGVQVTGALALDLTLGLPLGLTRRSVRRRPAVVTSTPAEPCSL